MAGYLVKYSIRLHGVAGAYLSAGCLHGVVLS
jgi:hypothetical protein